MYFLKVLKLKVPYHGGLWGATTLDHRTPFL